MAQPILRLEGITKRFPGVLANDKVDFELAQGEIHALLGENGAGKTTLMNVVYGLYKPDEGQIFIKGEKSEIDNPKEALARGIGMVHQHFMLVPVMTVTENLMLGHETIRGPNLGPLSTLYRRQVAKEIKALGDQYGLPIHPLALVQDLSVGEQQRVEIVKALYRGAEVLILDEPTAVLTPQEADDLFVVLRTLVANGKSIIFISHKLREVLKIADRITVMRDGHVVGERKPAKTNENELAAMMVGREVILQVTKGEAQPGQTVLQVSDLKVNNDLDHSAVDGVTFEVRSGEVLGIAGVQGNGQTELVEALTGLRPAEGGSIVLQGQQVAGATPRRITELSTAHIPEDRQQDGLVLPFPVSDNLVLNTYYKPPFSKGLILQRNAIMEAARERIQNFDIRTPNAQTHVGSLSGGNQQKVIVARELSRTVKLLIASQPTRGLDVGSIEYIHKRLIESRDAGAGVLLVSSELDEIMQLSDRIAVIYQGKIVDILEAKSTSKREVGLLMAGVAKEKAGKKSNSSE
ncbi:MAG: ABC transporter ATP-binding protein [Anaerolineales bacterium]